MRFSGPCGQVGSPIASDLTGAPPAVFQITGTAVCRHVITLPYRPCRFHFRASWHLKVLRTFVCHVKRRSGRYGRLIYRPQKMDSSLTRHFLFYFPSARGILARCSLFFFYYLPFPPLLLHSTRKLNRGPADNFLKVDGGKGGWSVWT